MSALADMSREELTARVQAQIGEINDLHCCISRMEVAVVVIEEITDDPRFPNPPGVAVEALTMLREQIEAARRVST